MKHFIYIILTIAALGATFASCGSSKNNNEAKPEKKVLVAYFSATGNTRKIANDVAEIMGGKLHEITPAEAYTEKDLDWHDEPQLRGDAYRRKPPGHNRQRGKH